MVIESSAAKIQQPRSSNEDSQMTIEEILDEVRKGYLTEFKVEKTGESMTLTSTNVDGNVITKEIPFQEFDRCRQGKYIDFWLTCVVNNERFVQAGEDFEKEFPPEVRAEAKAMVEQMEKARKKS